MQRMTLAQKNRSFLEHQARLPHNKRFDYPRRDNHTTLLVLAVLISGAFFISLDVICRLDGEGAKPGEILAKSEIKPLNIPAAKPEMRK